jgi:Hexameric tyrosine-coordinated heme protein (HTHP)
MNRVMDAELVLVPGGILITAIPEEGRALALKMTRHMIHNIQPGPRHSKSGRPNYATKTGKSHRRRSGRGHRVPDHFGSEQLLAQIGREPGSKKNKNSSQNNGELYLRPCQELRSTRWQGSSVVR